MDWFQGSVCKVRTKDPENYDEEVKESIHRQDWFVQNIKGNQGFEGECNVKSVRTSFAFQ